MIKNIHLLQRLMDRVNCEYEDLTYSYCAYYLLKNFHRLEDVTIKELCSENYISKSTIRRFCQQLGYKNFKQLKEAKSMSNPIPKPINHNKIAFFYHFLEIEESNILSLIQSIKEYPTIYLLFPNELYGAAYEFQRQMLMHQKIIYLVPNIDRHIDTIKKDLESSLIILLDISREYTQSCESYLDITKHDVLYITNDISNGHKKSLNINKRVEKEFEKYLYLYLFDLIVEVYSL